MNEITKTAKQEIKTMDCEDVVIVWGGANDISRNNMKEALKYVSKFANQRRSKYCINKLPTSCVKKEVLKFNRQVRNIMKVHSNVKQLEIDLDRKHFMRHGQHLNVCGKERTYLELTMIIGQFYKRKQLAFIYIPWKDSSLVGANSESQELNTKDEITKSS